MKKYILFSLIMLISFSAFAQTTDETTARKNSLAININGLLTQVFNNSYYTPPALLTYRRHFRKFNLRLGIGGSANQTNSSSFNSELNDSYNYRATLRAGLEFPVLYFAKWHAYMGFDVMGGWYANGYDRDYDTGIRQISKTTGGSVGASPVCGLNYRLNDLLSFGAEASFDVVLESAVTRDEYSTNGVVYNITNRSYSGIQASYSNPLRLNVRVHF